MIKIKHLLQFVCVVASLSFTHYAQAQDAVLLSQTSSQEIIYGNSIACSNQTQGYTMQNSYYRAFKISDYAPCTTFHIDTVYFGVDEAYSYYNEDQPITIKLYSLNGTTLSLANLSLIDSFAGYIPNIDTALFSVPFNDDIDGGGTLVVEIASPDGYIDGNIFFMGSNNAGETAPSYMYMPECGTTDIMTISSVPPPNPMDIIIDVLGEPEIDMPDPFVDSANPVCDNTQGVTYSVPSVAGLTYAWSYSGTGVTVNSAGNTATLDFAPGATSGVLSVTAGNGTVTSPARNLSITVNTRPAATISRNGDVLSTGNFDSYTWYKDNQPVAGANANTYTLTENGDYFVQVTSANGCTGNSDTIHIDDFGGTPINNINQAASISVYPNPVKSVLHIEGRAPVDALLYSMDGRLILSQQGAEDMDVSGLAKGMYYLKLADTKGRLVKVEKIVKIQ